jgi:hypothetical protein
MRPKSITVTSSNSPYVIPLDYRSPHTTVDAEVTGTVNYTASYTVQNIYDITTPATNAKWIAITNMSATASTATEKIDTSINAVKVVINSGAGSVTFTVSQSDSI